MGWLRNTWAKVTPWDTNYERAQDRKEATKDVQKAIQRAYEDIAPPPEAVDDDGDGRADRLINPETGETLQDYTYINEMLETAQTAGQNLPSFDDWLANTGRELHTISESAPYQGMEDLIARMEAGPTEGEWDDAYEHAARMMGLSAEEYQEIVGGLSRELAQGVSYGDFQGDMENMTEEELREVVQGQPGMSSAERELRERDIRAQTRQAQNRAEKMIESIRANSGSATRAYMMADQALRQINDYELQQQVALADEEYRRQMANFQAKEQHWGQMVERNQIGVDQYMKVLESNRAQAWQGYAMQMNALMSENQFYLQMHNQELGRLQQHVQNMYQAVNAELGVSSHISQQIQDYYGLELAQFQAEMSAITSQFQMETMQWAIEDQLRAQTVGAIFGGIQIVAGAALTATGMGPIGIPLMAGGASTIASGYGAPMAMPQFPQGAFDNLGGGQGGGGNSGSYGGAASTNVNQQTANYMQGGGTGGAPQVQPSYPLPQYMPPAQAPQQVYPYPGYYTNY